MKQGERGSFIPSRLFIYYNEREMEGSVNDDSGAIIRDGMKSVANQGVCAETMWPYDVSKFKDKPPMACYDVATKHQAISYNAVTQTLDELRGCLAEGFPVVFGFSVYESFESEAVAKTGIMPMPMNERLLGGHAVKAVGYDDSKQWFIVKNSWGSGWGDGGYFYMPYAYIIDPNMASDFWTIRLVEDEDGPTPQPPQPPDPKPEPKWPCDWSLALPILKSFVDSSVTHADTMRGITGQEVSMDRMIEAGLRGVQQYLNRVLTVRNRRR
jgi:hypothetical protein